LALARGDVRPPRLLLGKAYSLEVEQWAGYFGKVDDQLDLAFAFMLTHAELDAGCRFGSPQ
jgi:hypothetical protein